MGKQLHKKFPDQQVNSLLESYLGKEIELNYILEIMVIKRRRFFKLLEEYREDPDKFSISYWIGSSRPNHIQIASNSRENVATTN